MALKESWEDWVQTWWRIDDTNHHIVTHLNYKGLATPARSDANHGHVGCLVDEVLKAVENTSACGWGAAVDTSLVDGFASDAGMGVNVIMALQEGKEIVINVKGFLLCF